jgi:hypothetical protein
MVVLRTEMFGTLTVSRLPQLIPWRTRHQKPTVAELVKKFLAFYENRKFTAVFKTDSHWTLS